MVGYGEWEGDARGRTYGDICICIADSLYYKAETNKNNIWRLGEIIYVFEIRTGGFRFIFCYFYYTLITTFLNVPLKIKFKSAKKIE